MKQTYQLFCGLVFLLPVVTYGQETKPVEQPLFAPLTLTAAQIEAREKSDDPKINPNESFESDFDVNGPISIEYAASRYAQGQHIKIPLNRYINQLGIVTAGRMDGRNTLKRTWAILDVVLNSNVNTDNFKDDGKDNVQNERLKNVLSRSKLENPAMNDLPKAIDSEVLGLFKNNPKLEQYEENIYIIPRYWSLVFDDETKPEAEALYAVKFAALISKPFENAKGGFIRAKDAFNIECKYASENKSLTDWQKNDYELIAVERARALDNCIATIKPQMPKLLEIDAK